MKKLLTSLLLLLMLCCSGCVTYFGYDGPYEGRVIDRDTSQPIEGAVVHGTWVRSHPGPGGASSSYYDSREMLTDKNGNFSIKGAGLLIISNIEEMEVNVFKAGYTQRHGYWSGFKDMDYVKDIEWEGDKAVFKLRRMTLAERKQRHAYTPSTPGNKEIKLFMREENKENIEIGRPADTLYPEELLK
jgi:hypothetical protein